MDGARCARPAATTPNSQHTEQPPRNSANCRRSAPTRITPSAAAAATSSTACARPAGCLHRAAEPRPPGTRSTVRAVRTNPIVLVSGLADGQLYWDSQDVSAAVTVAALLVRPRRRI